MRFVVNTQPITRFEALKTTPNVAFVRIRTSEFVIFFKTLRALVTKVAVGLCQMNFGMIF